MAKRKAQERRHAILRELLETLLPAIPFGLGAGYATGNYAVSVATGLAISSTISVLYRLDQAFLRPRLKNLSRDWQLGLVSMGLVYADTFKADQSCIEKFGDDYKRYMQRVPRVNFVAGIIRLVRGRD